MGTRSPSKFTSLDNLIQALNDHNVGKNGFDYCEDELKQLIREKQAKKADKLNDKILREVEKMEEKPRKLKVIKNVDHETLKQFKILSIQREENEAETFKFLLDYFLESEGIASKRKLPF